MKKMELDLLSAIIYGLWGNTAPINIHNEYNWPDIIKRAEQQTIQGLLFDGIEHMSEDNHPPFNLLLKLTGTVCQQMENVNRKHIEVIGLVNKELKEADIKVVFMKGQMTGRRWPNPLHRTPGDIDFLVSPNDYEKTLDVLERIGTVDRKLIHEHHGMAFVDGVQLEPHYKIHNYQCPATDKAMNTLAYHIMESEDYNVKIGKYEINGLPPTFESVFLVSHIVNHIYEEGLGLRQLVDYAMLLKHEYDNIDWNLHEIYLHEIKMTRAWKIITCLCQDYLGVPERWIFSEKEHEWAEKLIMDVMNVGNFAHAAYTFRHDTRWHQLQNYMWVARRAWNMRFVCPSEALWWPMAKLVRFMNKIY